MYLVLIRTYHILLFLLAFSTAAAALEVPTLTGRINDTAAMLSTETVSRLELRLSQFERETTNQVSVLTIPTLQGDNIDQFAIRVAESWKLGQKGKDNGVLLILAKTERKVSIEVGMGLQGALPDVTASRIIRDIMRPHLKSNNFDEGVAAAVDSIIAATKGEFKAAPGERKQANKKSDGVITFLLGVILAGVIALVAASKTRILSTLVGGAGVPLSALAAFSDIGIITLALLTLAGLIGGYLLSLAAAGIHFNGSGGGGFYGGWGDGGFSGGSSSGSSDSFSGGGGDFDGGGSSDDY